MAYNSAFVTNAIQGVAVGKQHDLLYTLRKVSEARVPCRDWRRAVPLL